MSTIAESDIFELAKTKLVPDFSVKSHKGLAGRVGIVGGSEEYTGAPFYSAMCALRSGCDLAHVFCMPVAASVIKGYSPDLIVHPLLGSSDAKIASETIGPWLPRLHSLVIGPGLGRDPEVLKGVAHIVALCREARKPLVIDADGLWLATQYPEVFINYPAPIVMTPNAPEYDRLTQAFLKEGDSRNIAEALGPHAVVLRKGPQDTIQGARGESTVCSAEGSWRRCGGQGDLLSGSLGTFLSWELHQQLTTPQTGIVAAFAACRLTRECNKRAFQKHGRSTCASDMLAEVHGAFEALYGP
jgi:ATP-dependent NAD(P)H-hydrate dehydratase